VIGLSVCTSLCASVVTSWAQPAQPAAAPPSETPVAAAPTSEAPAAAPPSAADPAWSVYDDAFSRAASGDRGGATTRLRQLEQQWPHHPAAAAATRALSLVRDSAPRPADPAAADRIARGELVFWSTVGGVLTAVNLCAAVDCESEREYAAVYTLSVGGALALSLVASRNGVAQGEAALYNAAQTWGSWNALALNDGFAEDRGEAVTALGAQGAGLLAGIGLWKTWRPTRGDVALTNSFLLWSTVLTLWGHIAADAEPTLGAVVVAGDLGLLVGALTSTQLKMSRGRTLLIDLGGVLGTLTGALVAAGADDESTAGVALMLTTAAGLGIAGALSADWDAPPVAVAPTRLTGPSGATAWGVSATLGF
jgi:hypothetical protein